MHQQGGTIKDALDSIGSHEYVLPAIQREFVWRPEQVCNLFDSLDAGVPLRRVGHRLQQMTGMGPQDCMRRTIRSVVPVHPQLDDLRDMVRQRLD